MYFEVHVLVEGQELDPLKHIKYVHLPNVHVHHVLKGEERHIRMVTIVHTPLSLSLSLSLSIPTSSLLFTEHLLF